MLKLLSVYLRGNINNFVDNQVMNVLKISQNKVINIVESQSSIGRAVGADAEVMHFVFNRDMLSLSVYEGTFDQEFISDVQQLSSTIEDKEIQGMIVIQNQSYYYLGSRIDNNRTIVSLLTAAYGLQMEGALSANISNTTAIAIMLIFLRVMIWTFTIITPLQQIREYINKARRGEEATLKINRHDEIGELARELVSLQDELKHQEETKEEIPMTKTLKVEGMMCMHCEARVKKALEAVPGVESAVADHTTGTAVVTLREPVADELLRNAVDEQGYKVLGVS